MVLYRNVIVDEQTNETLQQAAEENQISETLMLTRVLRYWGQVFRETKKLYEARTEQEANIMKAEAKKSKRGRGAWDVAEDRDKPV